MNMEVDPRVETRYTLRIRTEVMNKIRELAQREKRSAAKEIEFILEEYIKAEAAEIKEEGSGERNERNANL